MTGLMLLNSSLKLLGYSESNGNAQLTQITRNRALPIINLIYAELARNCGQEFSPLESLSDEIKLPETALKEVMPCAMAMHIANGEGDRTAQAFWAAEYNAKRAALSKLTQVKDTLPHIWG